VGWYEGPPFGGGEWCFQYRGDTAALNEAVKAFAAIRAPALQIFVHDGPQNSQFLADDKDPKADTHYDWSFTVWIPASWHHLYNDPRSTFSADQPNYRQPVAPPRIDVYVTEKIDWKKVNLPEGVQVIDERTPATEKPAGGATGAVIRGDVFDMANGKPIAGVDVQVEIYKTPQNVYVKVATGTTNANGHFNVDKIPPGHCRVCATGAGYAPRMIGYAESRRARRASSPLNCPSPPASAGLSRMPTASRCPM